MNSLQLNFAKVFQRKPWSIDKNDLALRPASELFLYCVTVREDHALRGKTSAVRGNLKVGGRVAGRD